MNPSKSKTTKPKKKACRHGYDLEWKIYCRCRKRRKESPMSEYIDRAEANAKKLKVDQIMRATHDLIANLNWSSNPKKVWNGYRKKLRRII